MKTYGGLRIGYQKPMEVLVPRYLHFYVPMFFLSADGDDPRLVDSSGSAAADAHWADCVRRILYLAVLPHLQEAFPAKAAAADLRRSSH